MRTLAFLCTMFVVSAAPKGVRLLDDVGGRVGAGIGHAIAISFTGGADDGAVLDTAPPPAAWDPADPADSLYRAAREALADGDYRRAAGLFHQIAGMQPKSTYASDALYYEAFALYRSGETADLHHALDALDRLSGAAVRGRSSTDAATLHTRVCSALAQQGDERCTSRIVEGAKSALAPCAGDGGDDDVRVAALNALLQMDSERALPILEKVLARKDDCSVELRRKAVFLVSQKEAPNSFDILVRTARTDPDQDVREQAVFWLSQTHDQRVVPILDSIVTHDGPGSVREKAVFALSQQQGTAALRSLRHIAESDSLPADVREKAIFWIGQSESDSAATYLRQLFGRTQNEDLKEKILFAVSQREGRRDVPWLLDIAADPKQSDGVREKAVFWAGQGGASVDQLMGLLARSTDPSLREKVVFALSQKNDPGAVDALMRLAKSDKDPDIRKKAVFWLGQSSDPRAAQFLQEIISQ